MKNSLSFLKYKKCPKCNSEIVLESRGWGEEKLIFECGCQLVFKDREYKLKKENISNENLNHN